MSIKATFKELHEKSVIVRLITAWSCVFAVCFLMVFAFTLLPAGWQETIKNIGVFAGVVGILGFANGFEGT